jgi:glucosamine--fructose-6-phosphate aminotransferase (isomerizing)
LGRGSLYPIALEGALKLKEIGYCHAEGFSGGSLKHGPFALLEVGLPVILLSDSETRTLMSSAVEEIKSRGAKVIVISNHEVNKDRVDYNIQLDSHSLNNTLLNLMYGVLLQKMSYYLAKIKGHNPDFPKNLAKVVTVDG